MLNVNQFLEQWQQQRSEPDLVALDVIENNVENVYAFGRNEQTSSLMKRLNLTAIIDDYYDKESWHGVPVIKSKLADKNAVIINCVLSIKPTTAQNVIEAISTKSTSYSSFYKLQPNAYPLPDILQQRREDILDNIDAWHQIYKDLADEESRVLLTDFIKFSITADFRFYSNYSFRPTEQYFEPFMSYRNEYFVDAGGFIGDTSLEFIKRYPDYEKIYLFEPSNANISEAKTNLQPFSNIQFFNKGVSNTSETVSFNASLGSCSFIDEQGDTSIDLVAIDDAIDEPITFIKMDLEGYEQFAIEGAKQTIADQTPKLAIAVYHKGTDIRQLSQQILSYNRNYELRLRQYTEGWSETVMYFSPKNTTSLN